MHVLRTADILFYLYMHFAHIPKNNLLKFVNFGGFVLTNARKYAIIKTQIGRIPDYQGLTKEVWSNAEFR